MMKRSQLKYLLAATLSLFLCKEALAIDAAGLTDIIRNANILKYDKSPKVTIVGALITTSVDPMGPPGKTSDQDLKIDALLVAKALFDAAPQELRNCKIIFSNGGKDAKYTIISRQKVSDYSSGAVNAQELLNALALTSVVQENQPEVVEGPFYERRILVWERIENLRKQGTGVKPFEQLYADLEGSIKANDDQKSLFNKLSLLEDKLSGQEHQIDQAKKVAQGKGIHGNYKDKSVTQTQSPSASPSPSLASDQNNKNATGPVASQIALNYVTARMKITQDQLKARGDEDGYRQAQQMCFDLHENFNKRNFDAFNRKVDDFKRLVRDKRIDFPANVANSGN